MKVGSLFSGIGGLDLGLERAGMEIRWQSEVDPFCCEVLAKHWPGVPNLGDVTAVDWSGVEAVDLICGGFPCQPFSSAGLKRGAADERYLWPALADALRVLRPRLVLLENVAALLRAPEFGTILGDLADLGYDAEWDCLPAAVFGRPQRRWRMFIVAHDRGGGSPWGPESDGGAPARLFQRREHGADAHGLALAERRAAASAGALRRMGDGLSEGVEQTPRLKALGNAVVPQVAEWIGVQLLQAIERAA